jgi:hypothetical protein
MDMHTLYSSGIYDSAYMYNNLHHNLLEHHNLQYSAAHIYASNTSQHIDHSLNVVMPTKDVQQQKSMHPYELIRLTQCMRNNARLKQLELLLEGGENTPKVLILHLYHVACLIIPLKS